MSDIPRVPWEAFAEYWADPRDGWQQGEHVSLIGPTGAGKTTMLTGLLDTDAVPARHVLMMATKPSGRDRVLDKLTRGRAATYAKVERWEDRKLYDNRVVLWPKFKAPGDEVEQQAQINRALREAFTEGGHTVVVDEMFYLSQRLRLQALLETYWTQGRSVGLSLMGGTQRPAHVPLMMYDQATHLFFWRDNDEVNLRRIGGLGGADAKMIRREVAGLPRHDALHLNTRTGDLTVTRAPLAA